MQVLVPSGHLHHPFLTLAPKPVADGAVGAALGGQQFLTRIFQHQTGQVPPENRAGIDVNPVAVVFDLFHRRVAVDYDRAKIALP